MTTPGVRIDPAAQNGRLSGNRKWTVVRVFPRAYPVSKHPVVAILQKTKGRRLLAKPLIVRV